MSNKIAIFDLNSSYLSRRPKTLFPGDELKKIQYLFLFDDVNKSIHGQKLCFPFKIRNRNVLIFGYRVPELCLIALNPNVNFIYIQPGVDPKFLDRNWFLVLKKYKTIFMYLLMVLSVLFIAPSKFIALIYQILNVWFNIRISKLSDYVNVGSPSNLLLFDASSVSFFEEKLLWKSTWHHFPFFERKNVSPLPYKLKGLKQYICQTLVEDARLSKSDFHQMFENLLHRQNGRKLILIAHPRTDLDIFGRYEDQIIIEHEKLYDTEAYGHYSNLLIFAIYKNLNVNIIEFENHPIPDEFKKFILDYENIRENLFYTDDLSLQYFNNFSKHKNILM